MTKRTTTAAKVHIVGHPLHATLMPVPVVCFIGALLNDIAYSQTADIQWSNFSAWLLFFGMVFGVLGALVGLIDFIARPIIRSFVIGWLYMAGILVMLVLALFNNFVHTHDGWTSVMPTGLILSIATVVVALITAWLGQHLVYRHGIGVAREIVR